MLRAWSSFFVIVILSAPAGAADIYSNVDRDRKSCDMRIVGPIEPGDEEKFRQQVLRLLKVDDCYIGSLGVYSIGGHLVSAMRIGQQVFTLGLHTHGPSEKVVPGASPSACKLMSDPASRDEAGCQCASACFFIWAAGSNRGGWYGDAIQIHRPRYDPAFFSTLTLEEARQRYDEMMRVAKGYLANVGVPDSVIARMFLIDSDRAEYLTPAELALLEEQPHRRELMIAKCGPTILQEEFHRGIKTNDKAIIDWIDKWAQCRADVWKEQFEQGKVAYLKRYDKSPTDSVVKPLPPVSDYRIPPKDEIDALHAGRMTFDEFDAKYGKGSGRAYLSNRSDPWNWSQRGGNFVERSLLERFPFACHGSTDSTDMDCKQ